MNCKQTNCLLLTLLLWNPLMLLLLTRSWIASTVTIVIILFTAYLISKSKSLYLKVWAFNLCAIASIGLHAELLFREFLADKNIPNLYDIHGKYYFNKPFLDREFHTNEYVSTYKTNCQGYRMDNLTNAYDTVKACDWLFIGDSFTQGAQVNYSDLYTTLLFRDFPNKTIVNAGISGAGLYDELNFFKDKGKELKPKVVFLQIGVFNDFFNIKEKSATYQDYLMEKSNLYRYIAYNVFSTDSLPLGRWTEPFFPTRQDNIDYNILYKQNSATKRADIAAYKSCLSEWKREVESIGAKLVVFLLPSKEQVSPTLLKEVMDKYGIKFSQLDMTAPNRLFQKTAKDLGISHYDLTTDFKKAKEFPFFAQDEHLNATGHQVIARSLAEKLKQYTCHTQYISTANRHERYPSYYRADNTLLYQGQDAYEYSICCSTIDNNQASALVKSCEELVHPIFSPDQHYLAYTEGNQENSETDVILRDMVSNSTTKLNSPKQYAAIPMFNHQGTLIAFPAWSKNSQHPIANIAIYSISKAKIIGSIKSTSECWRPIFSNDDAKILFIEKRDKFVIMEYDMTTRKKRLILSLPFDIWDIALSPSGKYLVFAGNKDGNWDLFSYAFATGKTVQLTHTLGNEWDPAFGATDQQLWFAGTFGFNDGIFYRQIQL